MSAAVDAPIFVHGIYPRSGTNHLMSLLCQHSDCAPPTPIWEDFLLAPARHLDDYVAAVGQHWNPRWGVGQEHAAALLAALGGGIERFLQDRADGRRVVTKTPRVDSLERFGALFPRACLLILVRDGRAVVESGVRSFGWHRESATRAWARAADTILRFDAAQRGSSLRYRIVRYEELVEDREAMLRELLPFLGLDVSRYDFAKIDELPVLGSSTLRRSGQAVHWQGAVPSPDFDPIGRARHWSRWQHARFNWLGEGALRALGYAPEPTPGGVLESAWNGALDLLHRAAQPWRPLLRAVRTWRRYATDARRRSAER